MTRQQNATITKGILVVKRENRVKFTRVLAVIKHTEDTKNCVKCRFYEASTERNEVISEELRRRILKIIENSRKQPDSSIGAKRRLQNENLVSIPAKLVESSKFGRNFGNNPDQIRENSHSNSNTKSMNRPSVDYLEEFKRDSQTLPLKKSQNHKTSKLENNQTDNKPVGDIEADNNKQILYLESKLRRLESNESRLYLTNLRKFSSKSINHEEADGILEISGEPYPLLREISLIEIKLPQIESNRNLTVNKQKPDTDADNKQISTIDLIEESNTSLIERRRLENLRKFKQITNLQYEFVDLPTIEREKIDKKTPEKCQNCPNRSATIGQQIEREKIDKKSPEKCQNCPNRVANMEHPNERVPEINCCCYWCQRICTII